MKSKVFWNSQRGKAIKKLLIWSIFFLIIIFVFSMNKYTKEEPKKEEEIEVEITYRDMLIELLNSDYDYKYNITINTDQYVLIGQNNSGVDVGYIESKEGIVKYIKENNIIYQNVMNDKIENPDLFSNFNSDYLDLTFINNILLNTPTIRDNEFEFNFLEVNYIVRCDNNHVTNIDINGNEFNYNMEFSNIIVTEV